MRDYNYAIRDFLYIIPQKWLWGGHQPKGLFLTWPTTPFGRKNHEGGDEDVNRVRKCAVFLKCIRGIN